MGKNANTSNYSSEYSAYNTDDSNHALGCYAHTKLSGNSYSIGNNAFVDGVINFNQYDSIRLFGKNSYAIGANAKVLNTGCAYAIGSNSSSECYGQITLLIAITLSWLARIMNWNPEHTISFWGIRLSETETIIALRWVIVYPKAIVPIQWHSEVMSR